MPDMQLPVDTANSDPEALPSVPAMAPGVADTETFHGVKTRRKMREVPPKAWTYWRVRKALQDGELVRPNACERCTKPGKPQAHHYDYSKPLDVEWLCHRCHLDHHVRERKEAR